MKKYLIGLVFFLTIIQFANSQINIMGSFASIHTGRNINLMYMKSVNKNSYSIGFKYNMNRIIHDNQNNIFKKRFYATSFLEHIGFNIGYQYNFIIKKTHIKPFVFYDFQFTYSHTRNDMLIFFDYDSVGGMLYHKRFEFFGPTLALEHNIGIGLIIKVYNNFYLYQKVGTGIVTYHKIDKRLIGDGNWEIGEIISVGLLYRLKE